MYKNFFFLNRFIVECNHLLKDGTITAIFSQEKEKLILEINKNNEVKFLEISVNPGTPYITLKDTFHRAKKNSIDFFEEFLPAKIISFEIALYDRIIKINLNNSSIFFTIRGKYTNVYLIEKEKIISFKKSEEEIEVEFLAEVNKINFSDIFEIPQIEVKENENYFDQVRKEFSFIGKEIITETKFRNEENERKSSEKLLKEVIREIEFEKPAVFIDTETESIELAFNSFNIYPAKEINVFDYTFSAFNFYLSKKFSSEDFSEKKKKIEKQLDKELYKLAQKLNNLKIRIDKGNKEEEYNKIGNLLLINLNQDAENYQGKGIDKIELNDIYSGENISVKLDPKRSLKQNAEFYFDKAKNERISYKKSKELFDKVNEQFLRLKNIELKLQKIDNKDELFPIMKELKIKDNHQSSSPKEDLKEKFKHYIIDGKYNVYVGRDSKNNDLLTLKFAKQNDYWFHARSVSGSHVVLRIENSKEAVPKNILKNAASIAAYHSKAKTSGLAPVSYTFKKYVVKKKGMEAGKVALLKEDILLVKPEIPAKAEFISE